MKATDLETLRVEKDAETLALEKELEDLARQILQVMKISVVALSYPHLEVTDQRNDFSVFPCFLGQGFEERQEKS